MAIDQESLKTAEIKAAERVDLRRRQIFEAAAKVFTSKGYHGATVQDVAQEAGLGKGTLYEYVKSKRELLFFIMEEVQNRFSEEIERSVDPGAPPVERIRQMLRIALKFIDDHRELAAAMMPEVEGHLMQEDPERLEAGKRKYSKNFVDVINEGIEKGDFRPIDPIILSELISQCCMCWGRNGVLHERCKDSKEMEGIIIRMLFGGVLNKE